MGRVRWLAVVAAIVLVPVVPADVWAQEFPPQPTTADLPFRFDIAREVPKADRDNILMGLAVAQEYLGERAGGDMPIDAQKRLRIRLVADGTSESCCWATATEIFIDVEHPDWKVQCAPDDAACLESISVNHRKIAIHEYVHSWHGVMGCLDDPQFAFWLSEGAAEWMAFDALFLIASPLQVDGRAPVGRAALVEEMIDRARHTGQLDHRLDELADGGPWAGHIGYVAVEQLLQPSSVSRLALRTVCTELASGRPISDAFGTAFDIGLEDFYAQFEQWRQDGARSGSIPVVGDWNGDGRHTPGMFMDGTWRLSDRVFHFGRRGDIPVVGDWNGSGRDTIGIIRDGIWHLKNSLSGGAADHSFVFGQTAFGDVPVVGDWNGNGHDTIGIIRDGEWHLRNSLSGGRAEIVFTYGRLTRGDVPVVGDWNGDGRDTIGIVRDGTWHLKNSLSGGGGDLSFVFGRVALGDVPVVGDWNGTGRDTIGIVRDGTWHLKNSLTGGAADASLRL